MIVNYGPTIKFAGILLRQIDLQAKSPKIATEVGLNVVLVRLLDFDDQPGPPDPSTSLTAYNVAPTHIVPIIGAKEDSEELELAVATWRLVPGWWKNLLKEKRFSIFNAKSEEVASKSSFRSPYKKRL